MSEDIDELEKELGEEWEKVMDEEVETPTLEKINDKDLVEELLRRMKAGKGDLKTETVMRQEGDAERGERLLLKSRGIETEELLRATLAEEAGLLKAQPNIGRMAKELVLVWNEMHNGIEGIVKSMRQPRLPMPLIGGIVIVVALITLFTVNPEYSQALQLFLQDQRNQVFTVVVLLIVTVIVYLFMRRRGK